jgi:16S rRNA (uracil1498-N3)-methyltransferase
MARRRFFVDEVRRSEASIEGEEAEHLTRVLRAEPGQRYEICDGARLFLAEIVEARKRAVRFRVIEELPVQEPAARVTLWMSLIKFDRFEWVVEKATELGVARIVPVRTDRTDKGLEFAAGKRVERWSKIARAAAQQSRRVSAPEIAATVDVRQAARDEAARRLCLEETPGSPPLLAALGSPAPTMSILVGPEGGWTDREREGLAASGWAAVSLGPNVLRAETAAVAALAVVSAAYLAPIESSAL